MPKMGHRPNSLFWVDRSYTHRCRECAKCKVEIVEYKTKVRKKKSGEKVMMKDIRRHGRCLFQFNKDHKPKRICLIDPVCGAFKEKEDPK